MKKFLLLATAFVVSFAAMSQSPTDAAKQTPSDVVKMNVERYDFGKIKVGNPVTYSFEIKNISDKPLVVENSWASCGCTTPEKIVDPIMPGATAMLKVQYNAAAVAAFTKDVYVKFAGIEQPKTLHITGEVLSAEAYDQFVKTKTKDTKPANN